MSFTSWPYPDLPTDPVVSVGIRGNAFTINGRVQHLRGFTDFAGLDVFRRTGAISPLATQMQTIHRDFVSLAVPALTPRVLLMKNKGSHFDLDPREIADYFDQLSRHADAMQAARFVPLYVFLADCAAFGMSVGYQQEFVGRARDRLAGRPVLGELANEYNNGPQQVDPSLFSKPDGILMSRGSPGEAGPIAWPPWDFITTRYRRDPKWLQTISDSAYAYRHADSDGPAAGMRVPIPFFDSEPRGAGWRVGRYTDPSEAFALGIESALWNKAGIFHSDGCITSQVLPDDERNCAICFQRGMMAATELQVPAW